MAELATTELATTWRPSSAWSGILADGHQGAAGASGVIATARENLGIASIIAGDGDTSALGNAIRSRFGLDLPRTPLAAMSETHSLLWAGPGQWLLVADSRAGFTEDLAALSELAAVAEQSDGRAVLRLTGPMARRALAKGCMIDLHPAAFPKGMTALTSIAYIGVQLWRAADGPDGSVFEIMVPRSMAGSFWSWLSASAAEFGCKVLTTAPATGRG
jgi:sarcosine oxidase subunit gamma